MYKVALINVDELWLKGKNRPQYFKTLLSNVKTKLKATTRQNFNFSNHNQRILMTSDEEISMDILLSISMIPGVHSVVPTLRMARVNGAGAEDIAKKFIEMMESSDKNFSTFKVEVKRTDKTYPISSMDFAKTIGGLVLKKFPHLKVNVKRPHSELRLRIDKDCFYLSVQSLAGTKGLPVKSNGHLLTLISGGIDSPVASYMMAKRGCSQDFVFFYAHPYVGDEVRQKVVKMCSRLAQYQSGCNLYIISFGEIQKYISQHIDPRYRTLLFRRLMIEVASELASQVGADGLCTGDSLGQVSSQTLSNLSYLDQYSKLLIFRPLVGMTKSEIIEMAHLAQTYEISMIPHDDACALFAAKHPVLRPALSYLDKFDQEHSFAQMIMEAIKSRELIGFDAVGRTFQESQHQSLRSLF